MTDAYDSYFGQELISAVQAGRVPQSRVDVGISFMHFPARY